MNKLIMYFNKNYKLASKSYIITLYIIMSPCRPPGKGNKRKSSFGNLNRKRMQINRYLEHLNKYFQCNIFIKKYQS